MIDAGRDEALDNGGGGRYFTYRRLFIRCVGSPSIFEPRECIIVEHCYKFVLFYLYLNNMDTVLGFRITDMADPR